MNTSKFFNFISLVSITLALAMLVTFFYWNLYPYKPLVINVEPFTVQPKINKAGSPIKYQLDLCKNSSLGAEVHREFVNGVIFNTPIVYGNIEKGCKVIQNLMSIPDGLPSGTYRLHLTFRYQVNPVRTVRVDTYSEPFNVVENIID